MSQFDEFDQSRPIADDNASATGPRGTMGAGPGSGASAMSAPSGNYGAGEMRQSPPGSGSRTTLLEPGALLSDPAKFRAQWESVQVGFVDDPRRAVGEADSLVSNVIDEIVSGFREQHDRMEARWSEGSDVSTEDMREAFRRYRDFFDRLLQV